MRIYSVILCSFLLVGAGCAQRVEFIGSPTVPAATAEAKVTRDRNNNSQVDLEVRYLAPPENLTPPKSLYVVLVEGSEGRIMNMGQMNVDRNRRGSFKGVTPLNEFRILITAEDLAAATRPSEQVMLRTELITVR